jgi:hypothetical protein
MPTALHSTCWLQPTKFPGLLLVRCCRLARHHRHHGESRGMPLQLQPDRPGAGRIAVAVKLKRRHVVVGAHAPGDRQALAGLGVDQQHLVGDGSPYVTSAVPNSPRTNTPDADDPATRRSSVGACCAKERNQVRKRLAAGGRRIRTVGPSRERIGPLLPTGMP